MSSKAKTFAQKSAESDAMLTARDAAMQTPEEVRKAFLARRRQCGPVYIEPFSLGILLLFEEIAHPFHTGGEPLLDAQGKVQLVPKLDAKGQPVLDDKDCPVLVPATKPLTIREIARGIFIFHDSEAAAEELSGGLEAFDAAAMSLARAIDPRLLQGINDEIRKTFTEGLATIPGGGESNPTGTGS